MCVEGKRAPLKIFETYPFDGDPQKKNTPGYFISLSGLRNSYLGMRVYWIYITDTRSLSLSLIVERPNK